MIHFLYRHIRLDKNEPFYVGIGVKKQTNSACLTEYYRAYEKRRNNTIWNKIVNKTKYEIEILLESDDYSFIKEKEMEFIKLYGRKKDGGTLSNITMGGDGTVGFSRDCSVNNIITFKNSGNNNRKSIKCYQYTIGGVLVQEYESFGMASKISNISKSGIRRAIRDFGVCNNYFWTIKKIDNSYYFVSRRIELKRNQGGNKYKFIEMLDDGGNVIKTFESISEASKELNVHYQSIYKVLINKRESVKGYVLKYAH